MAYTQSQNGLLDLSNPAITMEMMKQDVIEQPANLLMIPNSLNAGAGVGNPNQAQVNAFFNAMTPAQLTAFQNQQAQVINALLTPTFVKVLAEMMGGGGSSVGTSPGAPGTGVGYGGTATSGMSGMGMTAGAPSGQTAANSGSGEGGMNAGGGGRGGDGGASSGGDGGGSSGGDGGGASGGGGAGGGAGGCCFIMLEARYGDGTMDAVVRRYRDEHITDRNKRGYYKLAEVLVPLMRESKLFKFLVAKTFADPLVSYGKWHYGQNKHGWIFKPVQKFWMKVFDVLGTDTKFIRENGQTV